MYVCHKAKNQPHFVACVLASSAGVGNFFGFAGHIRDELDIRGPCPCKLILSLFFC